MLKELLPRLRLRLKKQPSQSQSPKQSLKNQKKPTINLLEESPFLYDQESYSTITGIARKVIWGVSFLFVLILGLNFFLKLKIDEAKVLQDQLVKDVNLKRDTEKSYNNLQRDLEFYNTAIVSREELQSKAKTAYAFENAPVNLTSFRLSPKSFFLDVSINNALDFTGLISYYLRDASVSEIALRSSAYNSRSDTYDISIEVYFND